jgi:signal transduction histidine kinase
MANDIPEPNTPKMESPVVIRRTLIYFNVLAWLLLLGSTFFIFLNTTDGNYFYFVPATLYGLLIGLYPEIDFIPGKGFTRHRLTTPGMRAADRPVRKIIFVVLSLILVFWLNQYNTGFASLYFLVFGQTMGILTWRLAFSFIVLEVLALLFQLGVFSSSGKLDEGSLLGFSISITSALINMVVIVALIRSRINSEELVRELTATKQRLEEALMKEKEVAILRERNRLAREMHDVLGHALVLVAIKIEAAQRLQSVDPERAATELEATKELVRQSMTDLRTSLADLRSPALEADDKPLTQALKDWAEFTAKESKLSITCNFEPDAEKLPVPIQDALWRVGREAILNVVKHARAKSVELNLFLKDNKAFLSVGDDGVGIPHLIEGKARLEVEGHYGVRGMRERLEALGGKLVIRPNRENHGTLVIASVPLPQPKEEPAQRIRKRLSPVTGWLFREG